MSADTETEPSVPPSDLQRMVTVDKLPVLEMGEVVMYATSDHEKLQALTSLAAAVPGGIVDYNAAADLVEEAVRYELVRVHRKKREKLDAYADERQARAYVRGMLKMAELLAPKIEKLKRGVKAGL